MCAKVARSDRVGQSPRLDAIVAEQRRDNCQDAGGGEDACTGVEALAGRANQRIGMGGPTTDEPLHLEAQSRQKDRYGARTSVTLRLLLVARSCSAPAHSIDASRLPIMDRSAPGPRRSSQSERVRARRSSSRRVPTSAPALDGAGRWRARVLTSCSGGAASVRRGGS